MTTVPDFEQLPEQELYPQAVRRVTGRWDDPSYTEAEDAEFVVEDAPEGPQWRVWDHTYPWRKADARRYLVYEDQTHDVYWYRDLRNQRLYGMPDLELVRAYNELLDERYERAERRRDRRRRGLYLAGMFLVVVFIMGVAMPAVAPWLLLVVPVVMWLATKTYGRDPKPRYDTITEARFDLFLSDQEIHDRRMRLLGWGLTLGLIVLWIWWRHRH